MDVMFLYVMNVTKNTEAIATVWTLMNIIAGTVPIVVQWLDVKKYIEKYLKNLRGALIVHIIGVRYIRCIIFVNHNEFFLGQSRHGNLSIGFPCWDHLFCGQVVEVLLRKKRRRRRTSYSRKSCDKASFWCGCPCTESNVKKIKIWMRVTTLLKKKTTYLCLPPL